jgi:hypothetical protein
MFLPPEVMRELQEATHRSSTRPSLLALVDDLRDAERRLRNALAALTAVESVPDWEQAVERRNAAFLHMLRVLGQLQQALDQPDLPAS